eukprot:CAMPEP_0175097464 /NCGR_PEP_ID=MMETSP0086_2-20121207/5300_1 /TAXON_ID=136419 /ORGANISM="Unknown Unknown, Strain D1" /LENGTH=415 /DNA_ID=CAMNT_0016370975 /DNA_START=42 /DNA_END=1289 /DNA_ORIENTATION=+
MSKCAYFASLRRAFEGENATGKVLRISYAVSTYVIMFALVRVWGQAMPTHSYYYSMSWAVGFIPVFFVLFSLVRVTGTKETMLDAPWPMLKQSVFIGFTFFINYLGVSTSAPHVTGAAQVIITVLPLGLAVLYNWLVFSRKYNWKTVLGVVIIITASVVQLVGPGVKGSTDIGWALIFLCGNLPSVLWSVYFEGFHKFTHHLDNKTNTMELRMIWTNVFLVAWLLAFHWVFGLLGQPPMDVFWQDFQRALSCSFTGKGGYPELEVDDGTGDDCATAQVIFFPTLVLAALQAHAQIVISRHDTGLLATMILNVAPFLCDIYFFNTSHFPARYNDPPTIWNWIAFPIALVGVIVFSLKELNRPDSKESVNQSRHIQWFMRNNPPRCLAWLFESDEKRAARLFPDGHYNLMHQPDGNV